MSNKSTPPTGANNLPMIVTLLAVILLVASIYFVISMGIPAIQQSGAAPTFEPGQRSTVPAPPRISGVDAIATRGLPTVTAQPPALPGQGVATAEGSAQQPPAAASDPLVIAGIPQLPAISLPPLPVPPATAPPVPTVDITATLTTAEAQTLASAVTNTQDANTLTIGYNFTISASNTAEQATLVVSGTSLNDVTDIADNLLNFRLQNNGTYNFNYNTSGGNVIIDWVFTDGVVYVTANSPTTGQTLPWSQIPVDTFIGDLTMLQGLDLNAMPTEIAGGIGSGTANPLTPLIENMDFGQYIYTRTSGRDNNGWVRYTSAVDTYNFVASPEFAGITTTVGMFAGSAAGINPMTVAQSQQDFPRYVSDLVVEIDRYVNPNESMIRRIDLRADMIINDQTDPIAVEMTLSLDLSDFNAPVTITAPEGAVPLQSFDTTALEGLTTP